MLTDQSCPTMGRTTAMLITLTSSHCTSWIWRFTINISTD